MEFTNASCLSGGGQSPTAREIRWTCLSESLDRKVLPTVRHIGDQNRVQPKATQSFNLNQISLNPRWRLWNKWPLQLPLVATLSSDLMEYITKCLDSTNKSEHWYVMHNNVCCLYLWATCFDLYTGDLQALLYIWVKISCHCVVLSSLCFCCYCGVLLFVLFCYYLCCSMYWLCVL